VRGKATVSSLCGVLEHEEGDGGHGRQDYTSRAGGSGAVRLEAFGPVRVTATVEDDGVHHVQLAVISSTLNWSCTCSADSFCTHATAAAIETWRRAPKRRR
jgi:hypothetical protein